MYNNANNTSTTNKNDDNISNNKNNDDTDTDNDYNNNDNINDLLTNGGWEYGQHQILNDASFSWLSYLFALWAYT